MGKRSLLVENENAISAVIAVMLMVSITVAMAAVGYAYLTGMIGGGPGEEPAIVDFLQNNEDNTLLITHIDRPTEWDDLQIMGTVGGSTSIIDPGHTGEISVGQKISINDKGLSGTVLVTISHLQSENMVGEYTFEDVIPVIT